VIIERYFQICGEGLALLNAKFENRGSGVKVLRAESRVEADHGLQVASLESMFRNSLESMVRNQSEKA
jgi:hypothetical protein